MGAHRLRRWTPSHAADCAAAAALVGTAAACVASGDRLAPVGAATAAIAAAVLLATVHFARTVPFPESLPELARVLLAARIAAAATAASWAAVPGTSSPGTVAAAACAGAALAAGAAYRRAIRSRKPARRHTSFASSQSTLAVSAAPET